MATWTIDGDVVTRWVGDAWVCQWALADAAGVPRAVAVDVAGTVMAMSAEALDRRVLDARETAGRSEVERILDSATPPKTIAVHSLGVNS